MTGNLVGSSGKRRCPPRIPSVLVEAIRPDRFSIIQQFSVAIDRNANTETEHVVGAELCGVGALPHVLEIEVGIEILVRQIDLKILALNHSLCASNCGVLGSGSR